MHIAGTNLIKYADFKTLVYNSPYIRYDQTLIGSSSILAPDYCTALPLDFVNAFEGIWSQVSNVPFDVDRYGTVKIPSLDTFGIQFHIKVIDDYDDMELIEERIVDEMVLVMHE
jgi:hypothetical protein